MKKIIINENQRGLLFKNGKFEKLLDAGKHYLRRGYDVETLRIDMPFYSKRATLDTLLENERVKESVAIAEVADNTVALHYVNGRFSGALTEGKYAFWSITDKHEFTYVDISATYVKGVPAHILAKLPSSICEKITVYNGERAVLFFDCELEGVLETGTHYFWRNGVSVTHTKVSVSATRIDVTGQDLLTQDKVGVRVSFTCNYRVTDCVRAITEIDDYEQQIHVCAQLAMREYVGKRKLDEILEGKDEMSTFIYKKLKEKEPSLFVEFSDAGVKDIILPGEIRSIMNTVLMAQKRAEANVITRREEVASTRSLLNTARLMDENQTLYRLKELEYVERICENVGNITLNGSGGVLSQLSELLRARAD